MTNLIESAARLIFHVDAFSVPEAARAEFEAALRRNLAFLGSLPGFRGHAVLEKTSGPTPFNLVTLAAWEGAEAVERAGMEVRAHYREIGFDLTAALARWGVTIERGHFREQGRG